MTNDPSGVNPTQIVTLYQVPNLSTQAQISNVAYALGEDPFYTEVTPTPTPPGPVPPTPTPTPSSNKLETIFIIIFVIIVVIVLVAVGWTCYGKYKKK